MRDFKNFKTYNKPKKKRFAIKRSFFYPIIAILIIFVLIFITWRILFFLKSIQKSDLKYVYITGNHIVDSRYLLKNLNIANNSELTNSLKIRIYKNLLKNPWIKTAKVAILKPDTIYISIIEKKPLCVIVLANRQMVFSDNGEYVLNYKVSKDINLNNIIHINLADYSPLINNPKVILDLVKIYKKLDKLEKISYIRIEGNNFDVYLEKGVLVKLNLFNCDYNNSIERLGSIWPKLMPDAKNVDSISICYPDRIIIKWKAKELKSGR